MAALDKNTAPVPAPDKSVHQKLLKDYQSKVSATKSAKSELLAAIKKAGVSIDKVETDSGLNISLIKSRIDSLPQSSVSDNLYKLLNNYEAALKAELAAKAKLPK